MKKSVDDLTPIEASLAEQTKTKLTDIEKQHILVRSNASMLTYIICVGALRELETNIRDVVVFNDKYVVKQVHKNIDRLYRQFDKGGLNDDPLYNDAIDKTIDFFCDIQEQLEKIMIGTPPANNKEEKSDDTPTE